MQFLCIILGSLISAAGTIPYVLETVKGKTKPRIVTWLTWSLLTAIAGFAALFDGQPGSAMFALMGTAATGSVVVTGLKYGDRTFTKLDVACMGIVLAGLVLWLRLHSPVIAIWAAIVVDFIGFVPTLIHAWQKPHEETMSTFALVGTGGLITAGTVISGGSLSVTAVGYPLYVAVSMCACVAIIRIRKPAQQPAEALN